VISWVTIAAGSAVAGLTLAEATLRTRTGAGVVALVTEAGCHPHTGGEHRLEVGDTAVVVGVPSAVKAATRLLRRPPTSGLDQSRVSACTPAATGRLDRTGSA